MGERRRGAELENALLDAAFEELAEKGYASFTMDGVAERARTSRPVLYRRWADRYELVRAAILHVRERNLVDTPDTGTLRGDVLAVLRHANSTRVPLAVVMSVQLAGYYQETGTSPADLRDELVGERRHKLDEILERAQARGEVDAARVTARMKSLPLDLLRQEFMMTLSPVPDAVLVEIVDEVFLPLVRAVAAPPPSA